MTKRILSLLLCFILLAGCASAAAQELEYRTLKPGMKGEDVLAMKNRLHELGYIRTAKNNEKYTNEIAAIVKKFQLCNGLERTGILTPQEQALLYSDAALPYFEVTPSPKPTATPEPTPTPQPVLAYPPRDEAGYLMDDAEYLYENEEAGMWQYLSKDLQVFVTFHENPAVPLQWFEAEIFCRNGVQLECVETNDSRPGTRFSRPLDISREHRFVLGWTDDFYGYRINKNYIAGCIVRNGEIKSRRTNHKRHNAVPNMDIMAQFPDGTLKTYACNEITSQELLEAGAVNSFAFGPILVRNGEIEPMVYEGGINKYPRQALGMVEPGHYVVLSVKGRIAKSEGVGMLWLAERMQEMGVQEALNLDGGNTSALVFCGKLLTRLGAEKNKAVRSVTSLIGIGHTEMELEY